MLPCDIYTVENHRTIFSGCVIGVLHIHKRVRYCSNRNRHFKFKKITNNNEKEVATQSRWCRLLYLPEEESTLLVRRPAAELYFSGFSIYSIIVAVCSLCCCVLVYITTRYSWTPATKRNNSYKYCDTYCKTERVL